MLFYTLIELKEAMSKKTESMRTMGEISTKKQKLLKRNYCKTKILKLKSTNEMKLP